MTDVAENGRTIGVIQEARKGSNVGDSGSDRWPYSTPVYLPGKQVIRATLIECADCDWWHVGPRVPDGVHPNGRDAWEVHHDAEHEGGIQEGEQRG